MWELDHKESWVPKNWCFWTVVLEDSWESLDSKEIKVVSPKGNQSWIFIGRTDVEAEAPILWPPDAKSWLIGKDPDAGKDWGEEEKGTTEDGVVGWHYQLSGHEFEQVPGDGEGQGSLVCCSPWGFKESDTTEQLNTATHLHTCVCSVAQSCPILFDSMSAASLAPLIMEFSSQEYWSALPFPPPGDLSDPGIEHASLRSSASLTMAGRSLLKYHLGSPKRHTQTFKSYLI